jgi:DMSO/TMAO reductase YedYZ molybdopterin-dependent catalytic subunit
VNRDSGQLIRLPLVLSRRSFLALAGAGAAGLLACNSRGPESVRKLLRSVTSGNESLERWLFRHTSMNRLAEDTPIAGDAFPRYFVSSAVPTWDDKARGQWRLEITGTVRTPLSLTLDELQRLPSITQKVDHFCVEGWNARAVWTGVRVSELARLAGATDDGEYVDFQSFDSGYHESWDRESTMHPQTIIAWAKDGQPLTPGYGAPARLHSPVKLGFKNTKYLTRIAFMPQRNGGYWSDQGYEWFAGT